MSVVSPWDYNDAQRMGLTSGTKLGPYEIVSSLGAGGMGEVYRARDTRLDRTVAIKILPAHLCGNPEAKQRFEREARAISSLSHPNICHLYDVGSQDGTSYLVMEYLEGETLAARLTKGPLPLAQVLRYGIELAEGLEIAHRSGVVHRDLKPANVMLTKSASKLMDFGLAKPVAPAAPPSSGLTQTLVGTSQPLTTEGMVVGTFQYMSPEQVEGKDADARSDIFALGAVLYEMVSGKRAFEGKTTASVLAAVLERQPVPISSLQPASPQALDRTVKKCLAKDPEERWQSARDVAGVLRWIAESGTQAGTASPQVARPKARERVLAGVALLFALATLLLGFAYFRRPTTEVPSFRASILPPGGTSFSSSIGSGGYALSPDGSRLAFVAQSVDGRASLWVRALNSLVAQPLAGTEDASLPFWSPDGQWIGFFSDGKLRKTQVSGGSVQEICEAALGRGGTWNAQGTIVFTPNISSPLLRVSANGGTPVAATKLDASRGETTHRWPSFLPDGVHFLYLGRNLSSEKTSRVYVGSLDSSPAKSIVDVGGGAEYAWPGYVLFVRNAILLAQRFDIRSLSLTGDPIPVAVDVSALPGVLRSSFDVSQNGQLVYQAVSGSGEIELAVVDRSGKTLAALGTPGNYTSVRISPDGQKIAMVDANPVATDSAIWLYDVRRNVKTRFTFGQGLNGSPVWSPDGSQIAFSSSQSNVINIYTKPTTGAAEEKRLHESADDERPRSWSPDGRYIAFENRGGGTPTVFILPLFGDRKPFSLLNLSYPNYLPQFSPDGHWIAYVSFESGRPEVYVTSFPGAKGKWQVSSAGGTLPQWRHDGRELFYVSPSGALMAAAVSATPNSFTVGPVQQISQIRLPQPGLGLLISVYDAFPGGQEFVVSSLKGEALRTPLTLVTNWAAELKK